jgi:hypothetical protein
VGEGEATAIRVTARGVAPRTGVALRMEAASRHTAAAPPMAANPHTAVGRHTGAGRHTAAARGNEHTNSIFICSRFSWVGHTNSTMPEDYLNRS